MKKITVSILLALFAVALSTPPALHADVDSYQAAQRKAAKSRNKQLKQQKKIQKKEKKAQQKAMKNWKKQHPSG